jgi:uncharacterized protein
MDQTRFVQITRQNKIAEEEFASLINFIYEQIWQNLLPPQILTDELTTRAANNIITPQEAPVPDCRTCGACCAALPCVGVRPDEEISAEDCWDVTAQSQNGAHVTVDRYMRRNAETFACTALEGKLGEDVTCRIYERRPRMCHHFEAGSDKCHALRRAYGLEPFLSLLEMFEARQKLKSRPEKADSSERIESVRFIEQPETENWEIAATLKDGSVKTIHIFDPRAETWRQFEFDGLTLQQAEDLIARRRQSDNNAREYEE